MPDTNGIADLPNIAHLDAPSLLALASAVQARLDDIKRAFIEQGTALGIACSLDGAKKGKRGRPSKRHEE